MAGALVEEDTLNKWWVRAGQLVLTVAVTWFIVDRVGLSLDALREVEAEAWLPSPVPLAAATLLLLLAYFVSGAIWGVMVRDLGGPTLPFGDSVRMFMIANLGRYLPGKLWQLAGLATLAKGRGVPAATATAAAVLGHGLALVAASAIGMGAFLSGPEAYRVWGTIGAIGIGALVVLLSVPPVFRRIADLWFRVSRRKAGSDLRSLHGLRWLGLYVANWMMYALAFWGLSVSLGLEGGLIPVASAFAAAYVLGYLMLFAPAGLGPREGFLILFLTPHIGAVSSGLIAVVARLWMTVVELVPAGLFWTRYVARGGDAGADS